MRNHIENELNYHQDQIVWSQHDELLRKQESLQSTINIDCEEWEKKHWTDFTLIPFEMLKVVNEWFVFCIDESFLPRFLADWSIGK